MLFQKELPRARYRIGGWDHRGDADWGECGKSCLRDGSCDGLFL